MAIGFTGRYIYLDGHNRMIGIAGTVAISGGRGRATLQCVQSIHRIDAQIGRLLDINSAWRDPIEQEALYTAYRKYVNGTGPWAPIALRPEDSVHCDGEAIDSDDQSAAMVKILADNGWFRTVYRWVNGVYTLVEPWHYEYDYKRDKYFGGTPAGEQEQDLTPEESARLARTEAKVNNIEAILARLQNAILDPSNGIQTNSAAAKDNAFNAAKASSDVRNWIEDPARGINKRLDTIVTNTTPKA